MTHATLDRETVLLRDAAEAAPPVLLAGEDDEGAADPHIVRGID
ncbi:hypothetical protein [Streptomyces sp. NPDC051219]